MTSSLLEKRVLVTGGSGFLGNVVVEKLRDRGVEDVFVPRSREFNLVDQQQTARLFDVMEPQVVIHLAATVGGIEANRLNPGRFFYENMAMGLNVVEVSRKANVEKLVIVGTTCAYPKFTPTPFHESDLWNGYPEETNAPYGVAKRALAVMASGYRQQYGLNSVYLVPANLYGPRDNFDPVSSHVIPALIRKFVEAKESGLPVQVWGTGAASREFLYVDDAAEGIVLAAERYNSDAPVNLGTGDEIQIRDLVERIRSLVGFEGEVIWDPLKPDGQPRRRLDTSTAEAAFGFRATTSLAAGLERTIAWFAQHRATM